MVNRPFMVGPQSLLSRANSSSPAWRDGEGGEGHHGGVFFLGWGGLGVPVFYALSLSQSGPCNVVQGGASVREHHANRDLLGSNDTKTLAECAKSWHSGKHPQLMTP